MTEVNAKKQLVRATLVIEITIGEKATVLEVSDYLKEIAKTVTGGDAAIVSGKIELVKVSELGKQSRTKLGDVT